MNYELVITRTQPPCGGKPLQTHEIRSISTDDFVAFVRQCEPELPESVALVPHDDGNGTISIDFESGQSHVTYDFTAD